MRILQTITRMNLGGTAVYLNNLVDGLNSHGFHTRLLAGRVEEGEIEDFEMNHETLIRVEHLKRSINLVNDTRATFELWKQIRLFKPDIIHTHTFKAGLLVRIIKPHDCILVHTFHGHHLYDPEFQGVKAKLMIAIEKLLSFRCDALVAVGNRVMEELKEVQVGRKKRFSSIAPGIDFLHLQNKQVSARALDIESEIVGKKVIVWMGRLVDVKRPREFIELARKFPNEIFVLGGDGDLKRDLIANLPTNVLFLGWTSKELLLSIADVVVSTSESEGMPLSLIEAQAYGVPVIAPDVGSIREIINNSETGYLVNPDLGDLEPTLRQVLENDALRVKLSVNASRQAREKFSKSSLVQSHIELYSELASV